MANAEGYKKLELEPLQVPDRLVKGSKFIKWPKSDGDDTIVAVPVTLRLDSKGYILYWQEPHRDTECLDVSSIRDTRIGKYAKIPRSERWEKAMQSADPQIREIAGNTSIPLDMKCLTIVYGMKFPEPNFINFVAVEENPHELVKTWADFLLELVIHPLTRHISRETGIEKMYTRLKLETNQFGQIPVKKCIKMFGGSSKRVESALISVGLIKGKVSLIPSKSSQKDEVIDPSDFPLIAFKKVLQLTCQRPELDKVFGQLGAKRMYLSLEQLKSFLNNVQRDPRLNSILYPLLTDDQVESIIQKYEPNIMLAKRGQLSLEGLDAYLQSNENLCVSTARYALHEDMSQPMAHYFINSSHNTYLTGSQYKSKSTTEIYRQVLLSGCRCVELDCWEQNAASQNDEPYITHGFTLCSNVPFKDVIEAINESAFKTSQYPVILSFENHVDNPAQQAKMAQYCRDIFGDKLLIDPLETYPLEKGYPLPSPKDLLGKIIIKNKKQKTTNEANKKPQNEERGRHKRGSIPSESSFTSSSSLGNFSPITSPGFFPSGKTPHRTSSSSSGVALKPNPAMGRKKSEPALSPTSPTMFVMSPTLPNTHSEASMVSRNGDVTRNGSSMPPSGQKFKKSIKVSMVENISEHEEKTEETKREEKSSDSDTPTTPTSVPQTPSAVSSGNDVKDEITKETKWEATPGDAKEKEESQAEGENEKKEEKEKEGEGENEKEAGENGEAQEESTEVVKDKVDDDEDSDDEGSISLIEFDQNAKEKGTAMRESRAYEAMSSLVNYIQPVRFKSFDFAERRNHCYEISSFTETSALRLLSYYPIEFVNYNKRQMSRIYPKGARMDSSNYNPQFFWNVGCQLVALNFQTLDPPMQLNLGLFEFNGNCGFLQKPEHMRRKDRQFDPFTENIIDGVVAGYISIRIISGQFLSTSRVSTYVEVDMYGLVADTRKKRDKTPTVNNNGTNPHYDAPPFVFEKVVLPSMAMLRIGVMDTAGNCLGQRFLPVDGLRPGYRYITLRNEGNQPLTMPSLFVYIEVKDYIPEKLEDFALALANPIEYVKQREEEEREIRGRQNALKLLLSEEEREMIDMHMKWLPNGDKGNDKPNIVWKPPADIPVEQNDTSRQVTVWVGNSSDNEDNNNSEKLPPKKTGFDQLETFDPALLPDIKREKAYKRLQDDMDRKVTKLLKSQRESYDATYRIFFESPRRPSIANTIKAKVSSSFGGKTKNLKLPFEVDPNLPAEVKRVQMIRLLQQHFAEEKMARLNELGAFMKKFEDQVKEFQRRELLKLNKITKRENDEVLERKNVEKDAKLHKLPSNLSKEEVEKRKKDILDTHVRECVRDRKFLESIQESRLREVEKKQQAILMQLDDEERRRKDEIDAKFDQNLTDVEKIFDIRRADLIRKKGSNSMNINSVTYPNDSGTNDGDYLTFL